MTTPDAETAFPQPDKAGRRVKAELGDSFVVGEADGSTTWHFQCVLHVPVNAESAAQLSGAGIEAVWQDVNTYVVRSLRTAISRPVDNPDPASSASGIDPDRE